jgi:hypothetical protein
MATKLGLGILFTNVKNAVHGSLQYLQPFRWRERKHPTYHREVDTVFAVAGCACLGLRFHVSGTDISEYIAQPLYRETLYRHAVYFQA